MTCKDCIHYEVCQFYIDEERAKCRIFKDKSKYIELPCGVGDVVYTMPRTAIRKWNVVCARIICGTPYITAERKKNKRCIERKTFPVEHIGETVFLTKAEAEAKLKELNDND